MAISVKQLVSDAAFFLPFFCRCLEWFTGMLPPCFHFENVSVPIQACFGGWPLQPVPSRRGSAGRVWPQKRPALLPLPQADSVAMAHAFSSINRGTPSLQNIWGWWAAFSPLPVANLPQQEVPDGIFSLNHPCAYSLYFLSLPAAFPRERIIRCVGSDKALSPTWWGCAGAKPLREAVGALSAWRQCRLWTAEQPYRKHTPRWAVCLGLRSVL